MNREVQKYMLIFEPKYKYNNYENSQYVIHFNSSKDDPDIIKIKRYRDLVFGSEKKKVLKNNLSGIDNITTRLDDVEDLFRRYVSRDIFNYFGDNLYQIFIGYMYDKKMRLLSPVFNNRELFNKTLLVNGSKIYDPEGQMQILDMILDEKGGFFNYIINAYNRNSSNLSSYTINVISRLRYCEQLMRQGIYESDINNEALMLQDNLKLSLTSYRNYRDMLLLKQGYIDYLDMEKRKLQEVKSKANLENKKLFNERETTTGDQLSFFDYEDIAPLTLKKTFNKEN